MQTRIRAEHQAIFDHMAAIGTIIRPDYILGTDQDGDWAQVNTDGSVAVRVVPAPWPDCITRTCDNFVDPYWDVEIVEDPQNLCGGLFYPYLDGPSHEFFMEAA